MPDTKVVGKALTGFLNKLSNSDKIPTAYFTPGSGNDLPMLSLTETAGSVKVSVVLHYEMRFIVIKPKSTVSGIEKRLEVLTKAMKAKLNGYSLTTVEPAGGAVQSAPLDASIERKDDNHLLDDDDDDKVTNKKVAERGDKDAATKNALLGRFAKWRANPTSDKLTDVELKLMKEFDKAQKAGKWKIAEACIGGLEKIAKKNDTYSQMPGAPAGGDDTYSKMPGAPAGGDDTYSKMPAAPAGGDDTYSEMPGPPAGGDDGSAPLRADEDDFEVDQKVRDTLVRQFVGLQDRVKAADAGVSQSLHADKNMKTLTAIKAALEKVRAMLKKKQFVPIVVGEALRKIEKSLETVEAEVG